MILFCDKRTLLFSPLNIFILIKMHMHIHFHVFEAERITRVATFPSAARFLFLGLCKPSNLLYYPDARGSCRSWPVQQAACPNCTRGGGGSTVPRAAGASLVGRLHRQGGCTGRAAACLAEARSLSFATASAKPLLKGRDVPLGRCSVSTS